MTSVDSLGSARVDSIVEICDSYLATRFSDSSTTPLIRAISLLISRGESAGAEVECAACAGMKDLLDGTFPFLASKLRRNSL